MYEINRLINFRWVLVDYAENEDELISKISNIISEYENEPLQIIQDDVLYCLLDGSKHQLGWLIDRLEGGQYEYNRQTNKKRVRGRTKHNRK